MNNDIENTAIEFERWRKQWEKKSPQAQLSSLIVEILKGQDLSVLQDVLEKLGVGVATTYDVVRQEELLCKPIIWKEEDLESVTLEQWHGTRAYKTLSERSIEEGHEIKQALELMCKD